MNTLKKNSIHIAGGEIVVCWPQFDNRQQTINMKYMALDYNGCYAVNNVTICFITNNEVYVTPYTRETVLKLLDAGLVEKEFFVPFSREEYPRGQARRWNHLCEFAKTQVAQE